MVSVAEKTNASQVNQHRGAMNSKVHVAIAQLGLPEDSYRDILERVTGHRSLKACSVSQMDMLLREFRRLGWRGTRRPHSQQAIIRMIYAVWEDLAPFAADSSEASLRAFVRRQTRSDHHPDGIDAPEFLDVRDATKVLEGLKAWLHRARSKGA